MFIGSKPNPNRAAFESEALVWWAKTEEVALYGSEQRPWPAALRAAIRFVVGGGLAAVLLLGAGVARATSLRLLATPKVVAPGSFVRVSATGSPCLARDQVTLISAAYPGHAFGIGAVYGQVENRGAFSVRARIRKDLQAGWYRVGVRCGGGNLPVSAHFRVR
jgi:hypothetical protein